MGHLEVSDETRSGLLEFASGDDTESDVDLLIVSILQLIVATREFQFV
jgi:hypothetical protein